MKVEILGIVENMSNFTCPHCQHEIDIFSKGGGERTARQFGLQLLGEIELNAEIRKGGDSGHPVALAGEDSAGAKAFYDFAKKVKEKAAEAAAKPAIGIEVR